MSEAEFTDAPIRVTLPAEALEVTPVVARLLLAILIELSDVPVLDRAKGADRDG